MKFELNEQRPHSLSEFILFSDNFAIIPINLPNNITPKMAHDKLIQIDNVEMMPLGVGQHYFWGFFDEDGNSIYSSNGDILFKIIPTFNGFEIHFQPAVKKLLE